jgi:hypothetical protein
MKLKLVGSVRACLAVISVAHCVAPVFAENSPHAVTLAEIGANKQELPRQILRTGINLNAASISPNTANISGFTDRNSKHQLDVITATVAQKKGLSITALTARTVMLQQLSAEVLKMKRFLLELKLVVVGEKQFELTNKALSQ